MSDRSVCILVAIVFVSLAVLGVGIAWAVSWHNATIVRSAMEHGYEERMAEGSYRVLWVKAKQ